MKLFMKNIMAVFVLLAFVCANTASGTKVAFAPGEEPNKENSEIDKKNDKKRKKDDQESTLITIEALEEELDVEDDALVTFFSTEENKEKLGIKALGKLTPCFCVDKKIATIMWQEYQNSEFEKGFDKYYEEKQAENKKRKILDAEESKKQEELKKNLSYAWLKFLNENKKLQQEQLVVIEEQENKQENKCIKQDDLIKICVEAFEKFAQNNKVVVETLAKETCIPEVAVSFFTHIFKTQAMPYVVYCLKNGGTININNIESFVDKMIINDGYKMFLNWARYYWKNVLTQEQKCKVYEFNPFCTKIFVTLGIDAESSFASLISDLFDFLKDLFV